MPNSVVDEGDICTAGDVVLPENNTAEMILADVGGPRPIASWRARANVVLPVAEFPLNTIRCRSESMLITLAADKIRSRGHWGACSLPICQL